MLVANQITRIIKPLIGLIPMIYKPYIKHDKGDMFWIGVYLCNAEGKAIHHFCEYTIRSVAIEYSKKMSIEMPKED